MYGQIEGNGYEGLSIASLEPGIYENVSLKEVKVEKTTKADGSEGKNILTFLFSTSKGDHQHTEYEVDPTDIKAVSKMQNLSKRVGHIMTKFVSEEVVKGIIANSFVEYATKVAQILNPVVNSVKDLEIKVVGNVYNGKATSGFPGYVPFISRKSSPSYKRLQFTANENGQNKQYSDFNNASPDNDNTSTATSTTSAGKPVDTDF